MRRNSSWFAVALVSLVFGATGVLADSREAPHQAPPGSHISVGSHSTPSPSHRGAPPPPPSRRSHEQHRGGSHVRLNGYIGWSPGWWGPRWSYGWDPWWYGYPPAWGYSRAYPDTRQDLGALDIDVSPERAEVWVNGERLGIADDFDGFPTYLWLPKGTYDVVFYLPGYRTLARQYSIYPGMVIDVEDRLERGESIAPQDLQTQSHERRDERLRRDREAATDAARQWGQPAPDTDRPAESLDARSEPGRIRLQVEPADASVYLDGRFLGSAQELSSLRAGLVVDAGDHTVDVVRPGYRADHRQVSVRTGEEVRLQIELEGTDAGQP